MTPHNASSLKCVNSDALFLANPLFDSSGIILPARQISDHLLLLMSCNSVAEFLGNAFGSALFEPFDNVSDVQFPRDPAITVGLRYKWAALIEPLLDRVAVSVEKHRTLLHGN